MYKLADGSNSEDYEIGDKFEIVNGVSYSVGSIVEFERDDGSSCPSFRLSGSGKCHYIWWSHMKAYKGGERLKPITPEVGDVCRIEEWNTTSGWIMNDFEYRIAFIGSKYVVAHAAGSTREVERVFTECRFYPPKSDKEKLIEKTNKALGELKDHVTDPAGVFGKLIDLGYLIKQPIPYEEAYQKVRDSVLESHGDSCNECEGRGAVLDRVSQGPDGPIERYEECELCDGSGHAVVDVDAILESLGYYSGNLR